MANTTGYKKKIETWFRDDYLREVHGECQIVQSKVALRWGGDFEYDAAVFKDGLLMAVYCLSCSEYVTSSGKGGAGKLQKIKADILMMLGTDSPVKVLAFTGKTMYEQVLKQQKAGRLPPDIKCELVQLPPDLAALVRVISTEATKEVSPA